MINGVSCFAGIGGLDLAVRGDVRTVCYIEWDRYCQEVLKKRMQEGFLDDAPIWSDICSFNGKEWAGRVDIVFGGFPCQDISVAGKGAGIKEGTRSGLFYQLMRVVGEIRPGYVFLENVSAITNRGCDVVLAELSKEGYDAVWTTLRASDVGARHRRERWFCLAYPDINREEWDKPEDWKRGWVMETGKGDVVDSECDGCVGAEEGGGIEEAIRITERGEDDSFNLEGAGGLSCTKGDVAYSCIVPGGQSDLRTGGSEMENSCEGVSLGEGQPKTSGQGGVDDGGVYDRIWACDPADLPNASESFVGRVAYGVPKRVDRLKCLGNAVVPQQGREAWRRLWRMKEEAEEGSG